MGEPKIEHDWSPKVIKCHWFGGRRGDYNRATQSFEYIKGLQLERNGRPILTPGQPKAKVFAELGTPDEMGSDDMEYDWPESNFALRVTFDRQDLIVDFRSVPSHPNDPGIGTPRRPRPGEGRPGYGQAWPN